MDLRQSDCEIDLESGENGSLDNSSRDASSGIKTQAKALISKVCGVLVDGVSKVDGGRNVPETVQNREAASPERLGRELKTPNKSEKRVVNETCKKTSNKKSPKPPRPPRAPSLDAADQKLIKELTELAMLKRARIERMKALKKMKAVKESSPGSNMFAMVFTVVFFLVLISQGLSSSVRPISGQGSSLPAITADVGLLSSQFSGYPSASHGSWSPNLIKLAAGSDLPENLKRAGI